MRTRWQNWRKPVARGIVLSGGGAGVHAPASAAALSFFVFSGLFFCCLADPAVLEIRTVSLWPATTESLASSMWDGRPAASGILLSVRTIGSHKALRVLNITKKRLSITIFFHMILLNAAAAASKLKKRAKTPASAGISFSKTKNDQQKKVL